MVGMIFGEVWSLLQRVLLTLCAFTHSERGDSVKQTPTLVVCAHPSYEGKWAGQCFLCAACGRLDCLEPSCDHDNTSLVDLPSRPASGGLDVSPSLRCVSP